MPKVDFSELTSLKELGGLMSKTKRTVKDPSKVWQIIHFYLRPGDTISQVRKDARETVGHRSQNILAVAHGHIFGASCSGVCKTYKGDL